MSKYDFNQRNVIKGWKNPRGFPVQFANGDIANFAVDGV